MLVILLVCLVLLLTQFFVVNVASFLFKPELFMNLYDLPTNLAIISSVNLL